MTEYQPMDDVATFELDLYQNLSHEANVQQGALKAYGTKKDASTLYERKKSGHSVTVERLLWADGWERTTVKGANKVREQEMTLIVLKITLAPRDSGVRIGFVKASLSLEDPRANETGGKGEPEVQAWAPFHNWNKWNLSTAQHRQNDKMEGKLSAGYQGSQLSTGLSREHEVSWQRTEFDHGHSKSEISRITGRRNGVTWVLEQNPLENHGVAREFWATVLFSRPSSADYLVRFQIDARLGTVEDFKDNTRTFFGLKPGETKPYLVKPWAKRLCYYEGKDIVDCVDFDNLGRLRKPGQMSTLEVKWGPGHKIEVPVVEEMENLDKGGVQREANTASNSNPTGTLLTNKPNEQHQVHQHVQVPGPTVHAVSAARPGLLSHPAPVSVSVAEEETPGHASGKFATAFVNAPTNTNPAAPVIHIAPVSTPGTAEPGIPSLMIGWYDPNLGSGTAAGRLTALEARAAQMEARLAAQDAAVFQLQQALAAKDASIARLDERLIALIGEG